MHIHLAMPEVWYFWPDVSVHIVCEKPVSDTFRFLNKTHQQIHTQTGYVFELQEASLTPRLGIIVLKIIIELIKSFDAHTFKWHNIVYLCVILYDNIGAL